jgi:hypothetical protein
VTWSRSDSISGQITTCLVYSSPSRIAILEDSGFQRYTDVIKQYYYQFNSLNTFQLIRVQGVAG